jgi:hypothetical protein|tara:strand:- start:325 stop:450 length:126 start_codon:yes stop_codon:yes gene_type:complete
MSDKWNDEIRHQIDVITDSDWFAELVEKKVREILEEKDAKV